MASKRRNSDSDDDSEDEEFIPKPKLPTKKAKEDDGVDSSDAESVDEEEDSGASDAEGDDKKEEDVEGEEGLEEEEEIDSEEEAEVGGNGEAVDGGDPDLEAQLKEKPIKVNATWQFEVKDLVKAIKEVRKGASAATAAKMFGISAGTIAKFAADYPLRKKKKAGAGVVAEADAVDGENDKE